MPFNTYPVNPGPEYPVSRQPSFETNEVKFGDGYKLESPAGINARTDTLRLNYKVLTVAEKTIIETFLDAHAPSTPFYVPAVFDGRGAAYTCKDYTVSATDPGFWEISATLVQYHGV